MKKIVCLTVFLLFPFTLVSSADEVYLTGEVRTWTSDSGNHRTEAKLVAVSEDGQTITLKKTDGKVTDIALEKLSEMDRKYIRTKQGRFFWASRDGFRVTLNMADGTQREFPVAALTKTSQEYVRNRQAGGKVFTGPKEQIIAQERPRKTAEQLTEQKEHVVVQEQPRKTDAQLKMEREEMDAKIVAAREARAEREREQREARARRQDEVRRKTSLGATASEVQSVLGRPIKYAPDGTGAMLAKFSNGRTYIFVNGKAAGITDANGRTVSDDGLLSADISVTASTPRPTAPTNSSSVQGRACFVCKETGRVRCTYGSCQNGRVTCSRCGGNQSSNTDLQQWNTPYNS